MKVKIGTFNLNNLFSRFNFTGEVTATPTVDQDGGITVGFANGVYQVRTFMGRLVQPKDEDDTVAVAHRIRDVMDADVLAVQEVEHIGILKRFNRDYLDGLYPYAVLVEGNDQRLIDVGILSRLPIGCISSHHSWKFWCATGRQGS